MQQRPVSLLVLLPPLERCCRPGWWDASFSSRSFSSSAAPGTEGASGRRRKRRRTKTKRTTRRTMTPPAGRNETWELLLLTWSPPL